MFNIRKENRAQLQSYVMTRVYFPSVIDVLEEFMQYYKDQNSLMNRGAHIAQKRSSDKPS